MITVTTDETVYSSQLVEAQEWPLDWPVTSDPQCNEPRCFPSSQAIFSSLNSGSRMVIARAHRVAA